jgi:predicted metalloprotease with PDZ domain
MMSHAFLSGTSLFFFVDGELARPCVVTLEPPAGWRISTPLPALRSKRNTFHAHDYDELVDSPIQIGTHAVLAFQVDGTRFEVALQGHTNADLSRILADLRAITKTTGAIFGGFPFKRYLFIIHAQSARGGGLEHASACTLDIAGLSFDDEKGYQNFAELAAHEFFHAWNVKRIHDRALGPFDYTQENYTQLLWFHEGFTQHMQSMILLRAGLLSAEHYLKELAEDWTRYRARLDATSRRCPNCPSKRGSSNTNQPTTTSTAWSATTTRAAGPGWYSTCFCARPPPAAAAFPICSAACGLAMAHAIEASTQR